MREALNKIMLSVNYRKDSRNLTGNLFQTPFLVECNQTAKKYITV